ncbi:MAG TPA: diadenylate cyclase CdaA [Humidesulfovibrio sp.]|uniref:diadenylate cyclase CdaA n=1 Tax=Humidesulfovibrio sp. TaxID=2910988 RepID=UPI002BBBDBD4|nr:diadenylate cyclase CdaA [Humidesulfovibrio sp.]HWR04600.1 diadenylate cyclase CdaA [Humidesulfovibrio sp.]
MEYLIGFNVAWREALDILLVAAIYAYIIHLVRGTRAVAVIYGLVLVLLVYYLSNELGLYSLNWLLTNFLGSIVLIIIILFQGDLRRALAQMGAGRFWKKPQLSDAIVEELSQAVMSLAKSKVGALIVIERYEPLGEVIERGVPMDAVITASLLSTIFQVGTPLHDGAVVIRRGRIAAAGCILPLSSKLKAQSLFGTRHRAALGISEESDSLSIVVSEERGTVSIAMSGRLTTSLNDLRLRRVIKNALER